MKANNSRENRIIQVGRWIGGIAGSCWGLVFIIIGKVIGWGPGGAIEDPFWNALVVGIPSAVVGAYVGVKLMEKVARLIMKGNLSLVYSILKGAGFVYVAGAIILIISLEIFFIISDYTTVIGITKDVIIMGSIAGGLMGGVVGIVYGLFISLYMKF